MYSRVQSTVVYAVSDIWVVDNQSRSKLQFPANLLSYLKWKVPALSSFNGMYQIKGLNFFQDVTQKLLKNMFKSVKKLLAFPNIVTLLLCLVSQSISHQVAERLISRLLGIIRYQSGDPSQQYFFHTQIPDPGIESKTRLKRPEPLPLGPTLSWYIVTLLQFYFWCFYYWDENCLLVAINHISIFTSMHIIHYSMHHTTECCLP